MPLSCVRRALLILITATAGVNRVCGDTFLGQNIVHAEMDAKLQAAMAEVMGCGASSEESPQEHVDAIKAALAPMWKTLPKNRWGKVDWRMVRYGAHRYFMQQSSLLVKGLEPSRIVNQSAVGSAEILSSEQGGAAVDALLLGKVNGQGFSLEDMAFMLATLEQVIYDAESARLEKAYHYMGFKHDDVLSHPPLVSVIETYMVLWMLGDDDASINALLRDPDLKYRVFPQWSEVRDFAAGMVTKMEFEASNAPQVGRGRAALDRTYFFDDAHKAVSDMTKNFASFWEAECQSIKTSLSALDKHGSGRVAVADFYGANADGEWRFGESEAYLRELGALDETSAVRGKQVIISNYLQGASNCIVTTPFYMVCCVNECEHVLNDIEDAVGAPLASIEEIIGLVQQMSGFDDDAPRIDSTLKKQLRRVAEANGGKIPLHGRLFAQWMHYVFPRECPYPHKSGVASMVSIQEFGAASFASKEEVREYSAKRNVSSAAISDVESAQWMSQWTEDEEPSFDLGSAPWERAGSWFGMACAATAIIGLVWSSSSGLLKPQDVRGTFNPLVDAKTKSHFV